MHGACRDYTFAFQAVPHSVSPLIDVTILLLNHTIRGFFIAHQALMSLSGNGALSEG